MLVEGFGVGPGVIRDSSGQLLSLDIVQHTRKRLSAFASASRPYSSAHANDSTSAGIWSRLPWKQKSSKDSEYNSTLWKAAWAHDDNWAWYSLGTLTDVSRLKSDLQFIGQQFQPHPQAPWPDSKEKQWQIEFGASTGVTLSQELSENAKGTSVPLAEKLAGWKEVIIQERANQLLEEKFLWLFRVCPDALALFHVTQRGGGDASSGSRGNANSPQKQTASSKTINRGSGGNRQGSNNSNQGAGGNDSNGNRSTILKRFQAGWPEPEFLCVILAGDPDLALEASCGFHHPNIQAVFRVSI
jgi:hypothetical protein